MLAKYRQMTEHEACGVCKEPGTNSTAINEGYHLFLMTNPSNQPSPELQFADIRPASFLALEPGDLAHSFPHHHDKLHAEVTNIVLQAPLEKLLEHDVLPWDSPDELAASPRRASWNANFRALDTELERVGLFVVGTIGLSAAEVHYLLPTAAWQYEGMVAIAGATAYWRDDRQDQAQTHLRADLGAIEPRRAWLRWNQLTRDFNRRKIEFTE